MFYELIKTVSGYQKPQLENGEGDLSILKASTSNQLEAKVKNVEQYNVKHNDGLVKRKFSLLNIHNKHDAKLAVKKKKSNKNIAESNLDENTNLTIRKSICDLSKKTSKLYHQLMRNTEKESIVSNRNVTSNTKHTTRPPKSLNYLISTSFNYLPQDPHVLSTINGQCKETSILKLNEKENNPFNKIPADNIKKYLQENTSQIPGRKLFFNNMTKNKFEMKNVDPVDHLIHAFGYLSI